MSMVYLFAAYAVFWALTFVYVFTIASRQKRLEQEIDTLSRSIKGK
jgi:CcmD family protein